MLLVIHNLPSNTRYSDVKNLIQKQCALNNVILDNLVNEGTYKKVTVGVAEEGDAVVIERKLNGMMLGGNSLYVEDMRKKKGKSYDANKSSRWNTPPISNNLPSLLGHNTMNFGQNTSRFSQNNPVMGQMMELNTSMRSQNNSMGSIAPLMSQNTPFMGQITPLLGTPPGQMVQSGPLMVPPPLMGQAPSAFSGPFYMSPQSNDYGNYNSGRPMADQYSSGKDTAPSKNYGYPDTGTHKNVPDKPIPVWATSEENSNYSNRGYLGNEPDRYQNRQGSRRTKWDSGQEQYESAATRDTSKRVRPWAADHSPPYTRPEYEPFDRSYDRGQERYSRRTGDSGSNAYQRRPFDTSHSGSNYRSNSPPGFRRGAPRNEYRSHEGRSPPPKRLRADYNAPNFKPVPNYLKDKKVPKKVKLTVSKIIERDGVWRSQAAAKIVKEMFTTINTNSAVPQNVAFHKMKTAVRNRLLIILNNRLEVKIPDQVLLYRRKFKTDEDQCLYNRIIRHILHEKKRKPMESDAQEEADADPDAPKMSQPAKTVVQLTPAPLEQVLEKLPKYPQGKTLNQIQKQILKKELKEQTCPQLDPVMKKAVDLEIDAIRDIILAECTDPKHEGQTMFCKRMNESDIMDEIRRMITLNLAKRLLNLGTVPLVRILGVPKPPRKAPLDDFLKTRGVVSLKKSDRKPMYIATCKSYESFDNLCALKDVVIDNVKVLFKPMYLTAPPGKVNHNKIRQQAYKQTVEITAEKPTEVNVKTEKNPEEIKGDVNSQLQDIKKEIEKSVTEIKKEVVTPVKSKPAIQSKAAEVKQEVLIPVKNKDEEEGGDEKHDDNVTQDDDDYYNEDYGEEYPVEDSEVNEDDLEDY
ncbi:uncharacterized protein LOC115450880 [Manduca sexta]|uniref:uncharacterized protein LOC115450880 n=1 Tax=Manduca sexta TaxID=7130 RepID=UPI00188DD7EB|nr:uncharacterized protein LOC115450880 [Manduca sexta]